MTGAEKVIEFLEKMAKRSSYHWSEGGTYAVHDIHNEGSIWLATKALEQFNDTSDGETSGK